MIRIRRLAGKEVVTAYGVVKFDRDGIAKDVTREQAEVLSNVKGYEVLEETFQGEDKQEDETLEEEIEELDEELEEEPVEELEEEEKPKFDRKELEKKTVADLEKIAKEENIELSDGLKNDKIQDILDAQE